MKIAISMFAMAFIAGCVTAAPKQAPPMQSIIGIYLSEFERQEFMACNGESYWVSNPEQLQELELQSVEQKRPIVLQAHVSHEGRYGHLGRYSRKIQVVDARLNEPLATCPAASLLFQGDNQ